MNRRQFLFLTGAATVTGCNSVEESEAPATPQPARVVNAGPAGNYTADGVYSQFRDSGFYIVRNGERLFAISSFCTHRKCKLLAEKDHSFYCKCHGSTFTPNGHVTQGPAKRDLPIFEATVNEQREVVVNIPAT